MKVRATINWAARNFKDCLAGIKAGNRFVLTEDGKPAAEFVPVTASRRATLRQVWDALASIRPDWRFADDLLAVNNADRILDNLWDSSCTTPKTQ